MMDLQLCVNEGSINETSFFMCLIVWWLFCYIYSPSSSVQYVKRSWYAPCCSIITAWCISTSIRSALIQGRLHYRSAGGEGIMHPPPFSKFRRGPIDPLPQLPMHSPPHPTPHLQISGAALALIATWIQYKLFRTLFNQ